MPRGSCRRDSRYRQNEQHVRSCPYSTVCPLFFCHLLGSNSFDTVLIPTELVVDTCYASFLKLEGNKLGEAESKAAWDRRLAMVTSNSSEGQQEAFVISKYDLLPENLADMVQVTVAMIRGTFDSLFIHPIIANVSRYTL